MTRHKKEPITLQIQFIGFSKRDATHLETRTPRKPPRRTRVDASVRVPGSDARSPDRSVRQPGLSESP